MFSYDFSVVQFYTIHVSILSVYLCFMMRSSLASLCKPEKRHQQNDTQLCETFFL